MTQVLQRNEEHPQRKLSKAEAQKKFETQREKDKELITGVFRYLEHPHGTLRFRYQKYMEDGFPQYELTDGTIYKLPRMVARHLNQNVYYRKYSALDTTFGTGTSIEMAGDGKGRTSGMHSIEKIPRCEFKSLEFMDDDLDYNPSKVIEVKTGRI